jgi:hypothetical protein
MIQTSKSCLFFCSAPYRASLQEGFKRGLVTHQASWEGESRVPCLAIFEGSQALCMYGGVLHKLWRACPGAQLGIGGLNFTGSAPEWDLRSCTRESPTKKSKKPTRGTLGGHDADYSARLCLNIGIVRVSCSSYALLNLMFS